MLSFGGMFLYVQKKYILAALVWSAGSFVRANGIVYAGFFFWAMIDSQRRSKAYSFQTINSHHSHLEIFANDLV